MCHDARANDLCSPAHTVAVRALSIRLCRHAKLVVFEQEVLEGRGAHSRNTFAAIHIFFKMIDANIANTRLCGGLVSGTPTPAGHCENSQARELEACMV